MNTIPIIFNERQINRTVIGGSEINTNVTTPISVILLSSGGNHYRITAIENLLKCGFKSIVSMENFGQNFQLEDTSKRFPSVKFVVPLEPVTKGDLINIGMSEVDTQYVLVVSDNIKINATGFSEQIVQRLLSDVRLCTVPMIVSDKSQSIPVQITPVIEKKSLKFEPSNIMHERCPTLYPFEFIGIFNREKFQMLGGYDYTIKSPFWQNLDFSFRSWLWGEEILIMPSIRFKYEGDIPAEDTTVDASYQRFYLKNIAPQIKTDYAYIPINRFFEYKHNSKDNLVDAFHDFTDARKWVERNKYRFKKSAESLILQWENVKR